MTLIKRVVRAIVGTFLAVTVAGVSAVALAETRWFKRRLVGVVVREAGHYLNGTLSIETLSGNLFQGIELDGVAFAVDGRPVISIKAVKASYSLSEILSQGIVIQRLEIDQPSVAVRKDHQGWELARLVKKQRTEADRRGPNRSIAIDHIDIVDASATVAETSSRIEIPKRFDRCQAALSFQYEPVHLSVGITHVSCAASDPDITLNELSGGISVRDDNLYLENLVVQTTRTTLTIGGTVQHYLSAPVMALKVEASRVSLPEIGRVVPELRRFTLEPQVSVHLNGPSHHLATEFQVQTTAGNVDGQGVIDLSEAHRSFDGQMSVHHLDLSAVLNDPTQKSDITGKLGGQVRVKPTSAGNVVSASFTLRSPHIAAHGYAADAIDARFRVAGRRISIDGRAVPYGAPISVAGDLVLPEDGPAGVTVLDLRGHASHLDLRRLPASLHVPPAASDLSGTYRITGSVPREGRARITADTRLEASTLAGARIGDGAQLAFSIDRGDVAYQADMDVAGLDLQQIGDEFRLDALNDRRFQSDLTGHVTAAVHGTDLASLEVAANGVVREGTVAGGRFSNMNFDATIANDSAHAVLNGTVDDFNPAIIADRPSLSGHVQGAIAADLTFNALTAGMRLSTTSATVSSELGPSSIGEVSVDRATVSGDFKNMVVDLQTLEAVGADVKVIGNGTLAFNDTGTSGFWLHAEAGNLTTLGKLIDQPLSGIAVLDTVVGGNEREFKATGTLSGDGVKYGTIDALSASSEFTATIPDLAWARASGNATTDATFVKIAGVQINRLTAKTEFADRQVTFDLSAEQPQRSLDAGGSLLLRPDERELRLQRLTLNAQGVTLQTPPGQQAIITYTEPSIGVHNFRLVDATTQQISVEGRFGRPADVLKVTFGDIDMGLIDTLLLRPAQLSGRLNGTSDITGTKDALVVNTTFRVDRGKFRNVSYDALQGTVQVRTRWRHCGRSAAAESGAVAHGEGPRPARRLRAATHIHRSLRSARRQQPYRPWSGPRADDARDRCDRHAAGAGRRDRIGGRSARRWRPHRAAGRVQGRRQRGPLHGPRWQSRVSGRSRAHRQASVARQPEQAADSDRRPGGAREARGDREPRGDGGRLQGHRQ